MKAPFLSLLFFTMTLLTLPASAKKYALNYEHQSGAVYSYTKTDTATILSLIGGLSNNLQTIITTDYSLTVLSKIDTEHTEMQHSYERIRLQQFFNNQETLKIDTDNLTLSDRHKEIVEAFQKLTKASFRFKVSKKGDVTDIQGWNTMPDSLKLSNRDKQNLSRYIDGQMLRQLLALTFTKYPEQKIALQTPWTQSSFGSFNVPYQLKKKSILEALDKEQFLVRETGNTSNSKKSSIKMGDVSIDYIISAKERGERRCDVNNGMLLQLQFSTYINGQQPDNSSNPETSTPLNYIIKTFINQVIK